MGFAPVDLVELERGMAQPIGQPAAASTPASAELDEALLAACRRGDAAAFGELFERTRGYVHAVALHVVRDEAGAADVTQDVYLKLLRRIGQFDGRSGFRTWLYRIVVSTALDQLRRRRRFLPLDDPRPEPWGAAGGPEAELLQRERQRRLRRAVASLPKRLRLPLVLRFVAELSYREIGEVLGLAPGTVASRLSRAQRRLARLLDGHGEGEAR
ncbi:MAG TPA: RNA polymerase sigma factor [Thermoanaerobaculia bacterium]|nr:RNA polymerase sigma factor [Thermoanaerobaculia bacterium]